MITIYAVMACLLTHFFSLGDVLWFSPLALGAITMWTQTMTGVRIAAVTVTGGSIHQLTNPKA